MMKKTPIRILFILVHFIICSCVIEEYNKNISANELISLTFEYDTINPLEKNQLIVTAVLDNSNVDSETDITFETSAGHFTKLPGGSDNLGKTYTIRSTGLTAQIILNIDETIENDIIVGASIKDINTNNIYTRYEKIYINHF